MPERNSQAGITQQPQPLLSLNTHNDNWRDPEVSPAQPDGQPAQTTTTPIPDDRRSYHEELVATWKDKLENASAAEILSWAAEQLDGPVAITLSMQDTILAELAQRAFDGQQADAELVFLDTGYHFPETLDTAAAVEERYNLPLRRITPTLSRAEQDDVYGPNLYQRNPTACCRMRKVEPLARMLDPFEAWVSGVRRVDSPLRANTPVIEVDRTGRLKLNPIAAWTDDDVQRFIEDNDLIINPLTKQGYPSIGCATCTLPVAEGEDPRSGRWAGTNKTECGLHV
ncbi:phosphoadenylyl-sulfate reductase [Corynebacterium sp. MSK039]|uniref:phosphoadenylyl-sulfate reductase n=1 Tax=Corynebacterium sp. MSK039 TaxID=3050193 RepID=UPI0025501424|nr:phosphoadenylyl-sulfate reductase [Corynebacterium sp. MSK039]MDK8790886.1 phosphoadenylyl-sulfate reductase [Corynebacterium sp. MSK039]